VLVTVSEPGSVGSSDGEIVHTLQEVLGPRGVGIRWSYVEIRGGVSEGYAKHSDHVFRGIFELLPPDRQSSIEFIAVEDRSLGGLVARLWRRIGHRDDVPQKIGMSARLSSGL
jgi:hypothetical protein